MARYDAIWVDDEWRRTGKERDFLDRALMRVRDALEGCADVNWTLCDSVGDACTEVHQSDYRLAIIDYEYKDQRFEMARMVQALVEHRIPFIVFTNFVAQALAEPAVDDDDLRLAMVQKGAEGCDELKERVKTFFLAPPVRLLHVSDLHYDGDAKGADRDEQDGLFESLIEAAKSVHRVGAVDGLAISGDISAKNPAVDLISSRPVLMDLVRATIGSEAIERLLLIPGNHDLVWDDFDARKSSATPWAAYLDLLQALYGSRADVLSEMACWDRERHLLTPSARNSELSWHRDLGNERLSVIGLATPNHQPEECGNGVFTREHQKFITQSWGMKRTHGNIRLALMHHNLFATLSISAHDEKHTLANPGDAMHTLLGAQCDAVLSGHAHVANVMACNASRVGIDGVSELGSVVAVSAGTAGGIHPARDRARSFGVLEFGDADAAGVRNLRLRPFLYESSERKWIERRGRTIRMRAT